MATEQIVKDARYLELTRVEAGSIIGKLGAQLADEYLPVNYYSYGESAAFVRIFNESGNVGTRMLLIVDSKPRDVAGELVDEEEDETIIILSRIEAADIIGSLAKQLAKGFGECASVSVQDRGRVLYRLVFMFNRK